MTWILFSSPRSPFVRKVMIAAHEAQLADDVHCQDVATTPMRPSPEVKAWNPLGMIPTLLVDQQVLFDSQVIIDFFQERSGIVFTPLSGTARRECLSRHAIINGMLEKGMKMLGEGFRVQNDDTAIHIAAYTAAIADTLRWYEARLATDRFDLGDITLAAALAWLSGRFPHLRWQEMHPHLADWYRQIEQRPSMRNTALGDHVFSHTSVSSEQPGDGDGCL